MDVLTFFAVVLGEVIFLFSVGMICASLDRMAKAKVEAATVQWPGVVVHGEDRTTEPK